MMRLIMVHRCQCQSICVIQLNKANNYGLLDEHWSGDEKERSVVFEWEQTMEDFPATARTRQAGARTVKSNPKLLTQQSHTK